MFTVYVSLFSCLFYLNNYTDIISIYTTGKPVIYRSKVKSLSLGRETDTVEMRGRGTKLTTYTVFRFIST